MAVPSGTAIIRSSSVMIQAIGAAFAAQTARLPRAKAFRIETVRRFACGEEGVAAVEFGIVAAPFLALLFAIMETALVFFAGQVLETAVADSARMIMTGQAQALGWDDVKFKADACKRTNGLFNCPDLQIDVKAYSGGFSSVGNAKPV